MLVLLVLAWLPLLASAVMLTTFWLVDELSGRQWLLFGGWFVGAVWFQFFAGGRWSPTVGLVAQAFLAITLILRSKLR